MCFRYCDTDVQANNTLIVTVLDVGESLFCEGKWLFSGSARRLLDRAHG